MEVIGAAGSVNKCNNKKKKREKTDDTWNLHRCALENESTGDIKDAASSS